MEVKCCCGHQAPTETDNSQDMLATPAPPPTPDVKPGWLTTEFWATLGTVAASLISGLAVLGYLNQADQKLLTTTVGQGLTGLQMFLVNVFALVQYVKSRQALKTTVLTEHTQQLADYHTAANQRLLVTTQYAYGKHLMAQAMSAPVAAPSTPKPPTPPAAPAAPKPPATPPAVQPK